MKRKTILTLLPIWLIGIIAIVALIRAGSGDAKYETVAAQKMDLTQEVSVTGAVKPSREVSLSFETSGKIAKVAKTVGAQASEGEVIVSLENADLQAESRQAQARIAGAQAGVLDMEASLQRERARFNEVKKGSRPEEIRLSEIKAENGRQALIDAEVNLGNTENYDETTLSNLYSDAAYLIADAYSQSLTAVNRQTDAMFNDDLTSSPRLTFTTSSLALQSSVENQRTLARLALQDLSALTAQAAPTQSQLDDNLDAAELKLNVIKNFLLDLERAINLIIGVAEDNQDEYRADIDSALSDVGASLRSVADKKQAIAAQKSSQVKNLAIAEASLNTARGAYLSAVRELELKEAGSTAEQIEGAAAQVKQAEANLASAKARVREMEASLLGINARLAKTLLRAPFSGTITKQDAEAGEIAASFSPLVSLISANLYEVEVNVPEADIAKIKVGNQVKITFDAYGQEEIFPGRLASIDPAASIVQGVATYRAVIGFSKEDERIKGGLTANVDIITGQRPAALAVPERFVLSRENKKFIRLLRGQEAVEVEVKTGLSDGKGNIEIIEGVEEGERVVVNYLISN